MPYLAISGAPIQYQKKNGGFASNYYLKFYAAGTEYNQILVSVNKSATDSLGNNLLLDKVRLNTKGYPVGRSGGTMIPHIDQEYKIALYRNADAADADDVSQADWIVDGVAPGLVGQTEEDLEINAEDVIYIESGSATERTLASKLREYVSVTDYGATGNSVTDDTTAFTTALLSNNNIFVPAGPYRIGGIVVQNDGQSIHFEPGAVFYANANDITLFTQNASLSVHSGSLRFDANGFTGVNGVVLGPTDLDDISTKKNQIGNYMPNVKGSSGLNDLVIIQSGPSVDGSQSFNSRNYWRKIESGGAVRGVHFKPGPHEIASYPIGHYIEHFYGSGGNTGIQIDAGNNIEIKNFQASGINTSGSPNSTATAFKLLSEDPATGLINSQVKINGGVIANCSRDMDIDREDFDYGSLTFDESKVFYRATPIHRPVVQEQAKIYFGRVNADGTKIKLPLGWASRVDNGAIFVDHNLGSSDYSVTVTGVASFVPPGTGGSSGTVTNLIGLADNSFAVQSLENKSSGGDVSRLAAFEFMLIKY